MSNNDVSMPEQTSDRPGTPDWVRYAIGWHVYPLGFVGAPIREGDQAVSHQAVSHQAVSLQEVGNLAPGEAGDAVRADTSATSITQLVPWLDYAQTLGVNAVQLGPVFASTSHGYDTVDYFRIDTRLGSQSDMDEFIGCAHERGIKVLFDGVFNHIGSQSPLFRTAVDEPDSPEAQLFSIDRSAEQPTAPCFEGNVDLVEFDHSSPATMRFVESVMGYWLERGVDGWRLDAAYAVDPTFWAEILRNLRQKFPNAYFYGEVIHGDYPHIVSASAMDSVTEYELWKAVWSSLKEGNFYELEWTLRRHNDFLETFVPVTFVGNHDVTRIASMVGQDKAIVALTILMTVGGFPLIYYGDEQGYTGIKEERFGGDDQIRPAMPQSPDQLSSLGQWIYRAHQQLISLRRRHPWLHTARTTVTELDNKQLSYTSAATDGSGAEVTVRLNVDGHVSAEVKAGDAVEFTFPTP